MYFKEDGFISSPFGPPDLAGVYAICHLSLEDLRNGKKNFHCIYIGSSINISRRLHNSKHPFRRMYHLSDTHIATCLYFLTDNYKEKEIELIKKYKPIRNKQHNSDNCYKK